MVCEVCYKDTAIGVASLPFGAYSASFCYDCLFMNAFPLWSLFYLWTFVADFDDKRLHESCLYFKSFHRGRYIDWQEMKVLYSVRPIMEIANDQRRDSSAAGISDTRH